MPAGGWANAIRPYGVGFNSMGISCRPHETAGGMGECRPGDGRMPFAPTVLVLIQFGFLKISARHKCRGEWHSPSGGFMSIGVNPIRVFENLRYPQM